MVIKRLWRRSEVSKLSGLSISQLLTLQKHGILNPLRDGGLWMFSWEEMLVCRAIKRLHSVMGLARIKQVSDCLTSKNGLLRCKRLIASESGIYWIPDTPEAVRELFIKITGKGRGRITTSFTVADLVNDLREAGLGCMSNTENPC